MKKIEIKNFAFRLDMEVFNKIVRAAKDNKRSINGEMAFRLNQSFTPKNK